MVSTLVIMVVLATVGSIGVFLMWGAAALRSRRWALGVVPLLAACFMGAGAAFIAEPLLLPCGLRGCDLDRAVQQARRRTEVLDRRGHFLGILEPGRGPWIQLDSFPRPLQVVVLQREDRRFLTHRGVDPIGVLRSLASLILRHGREGASTIPMQVAQLTAGEFGLRRMPPDGTLTGKLAEVAVGARLLDRLGRDGVLELYLNNVPLGPVYGIGPAARHLFDEDIRRLRLPEYSMLAVMIKAPTALSPLRAPRTARRERDGFLATLAERGVISARAAEEASQAPLAVSPPRRGPRDDALRAVRDELTRRGDSVFEGDSIRTTIDLRLQRAAWQELGGALETIGKLPRARDLEGVFVALAGDGEVRAWVSGSPLHSPRGYDRLRFGAVRLASTAKPLLLACALERGVVELDETLADLEARSRIDLADPWIRKIRTRADLDSTVREAMARSENWLAVLLWSLVPDFEVTRTTEAGWPLDGMFRAPDALGTGLVPAATLLGAYASFLNGGRMVRPRLFDTDSIRDRKLWRASTVRDVRSALEEVAESGTAWRAGEIARSAGVKISAKTGTTGAASGSTMEMIIVGLREEPGEPLAGLMWVGRDEPAPIAGRATAGAYLARSWARAMTIR